MTPETPILMITLQIPVNAETSADDVLQAIGQKVSEAINEIKQRQAVPEMDENALEEQRQFRESLLDETTERFSEQTNPDLLSALGYAAE